MIGAFSQFGANILGLNLNVIKIIFFYFIIRRIQTRVFPSKKPKRDVALAQLNNNPLHSFYFIMIYQTKNEF